MAKNKNGQFPKEILVTQELPDGNEDPYLVINEHMEDLNYNEAGKKVAVYKLVEVKTLDVNVELK